MNIDLKPHERLVIDQETYIVQPDPNPDMAKRPYVEWGGSGLVVQLKNERSANYYALKIFNNPNTQIISSTKNLKKNNVSQLPGLIAANRIVISSQFTEYSTLIKNHPQLECSVLMPWLGGYTWLEVLGDNKNGQKIPTFTRDISLFFALKLSYILSSLENKGFAHCDLCSNNIILDFKNADVYLIDIEEMFLPGVFQPPDFIGGQSGYAHPVRPLGHQWLKVGDRFGGGMLISELVSWYDPTIRKSSDEESYAAPDELCVDERKYQTMVKALNIQGGTGLVNAFDKLWHSKNLTECPKLGEWHRQFKVLLNGRDLPKPDFSGLSEFGPDGRIRIQRKRVSVTRQIEEEKPSASVTRKKIDVGASPSPGTGTVLPTFQSAPDWGKVAGWVLAIILLIVILIIISTAMSGYSIIKDAPPSMVLSPEYVAPLVVSVSKSPRPTLTKSVTVKPTKTLDANASSFAKYSCPDKSQIRLRVGSRARIPHYDVNLRSSPKVPDTWDANIIVTLRKDDKMTVIGGPECSHDGTWWEVRTDEGQVGWVRELQPNKILLEPIS